MNGIGMWFTLFRSSKAVAEGLNLKICELIDYVIKEQNEIESNSNSVSMIHWDINKVPTNYFFYILLIH